MLRSFDPDEFRDVRFGVRGLVTTFPSGPGVEIVLGITCWAIGVSIFNLS